MEGRKQNTSKEGYHGKSRAELEDYQGVQTSIWITENNITNFTESNYGLLEQILSPSNLNLAYKRVKSNKGKGGVDKMEVDSLKDYLIEHKDALLASIMDGSYRPNPVLRVSIPKDKGTRQLGIPTVVDRFIQQAIHQIISPIYESDFSDSSHGFRPRRSTHGALVECQGYVTAGYKYAVDLDLEKFFDTVSQHRLIELLSRKVKDGRLVSLIHKYLQSGVVIGHKFEYTEKGVPQGGPLSPLLSNIMLNELDKELERREHKFVRYADDVVILTKSKRSSKRVLHSITRYIENRLSLKVNREKSSSVSVSRINFLGYSFYINRGQGRLRVAQKSILKLKSRIRYLTNRSNGWSNERRKSELKTFIRGWIQYFKLADMRKLLIGIDEWYRRRLRMVIWKQWKRIRTRLRSLIKLGISKSKAWQFANTRKSYWHTSNSPILSTSITNNRLRQAGYLFFLDCYQSVKV